MCRPEDPEPANLRLAAISAYSTGVSKADLYEVLSDEHRRQHVARHRSGERDCDEQGGAYALRHHRGSIVSEPQVPSVGSFLPEVEGEHVEVLADEVGDHRTRDDARDAAEDEAVVILSTVRHPEEGSFDTNSLNTHSSATCYML